MAITVTHKFVSPKTEQSDPTIVGPNEWNATHVVVGTIGDSTFNNTTYNFCTVSSASLVIGANSVLLGPSIQGIAVNNYLYVNDGINSEAVPITGWNPTTGQVIITCARTHSAGCSVCSATSGIQEALVAAGTSGFILVDSGLWPIYAPINVPGGNSANWQGYTVQGRGRFVTTLQIAASFSLSYPAVFVLHYSTAMNYSYPGSTFRDFGVVLIQDYTKLLPGFTHWPPVFLGIDIANILIQNIYVSGGWNAVVIGGSVTTTGQWTIEDCEFGCFGPGIITIDGSADVHRISNCHFWPFLNQNPPSPNPATMFDPAVTGILINNASGVIIHGCYFLTGTGIRFGPSNGTSFVVVSDTGFDVFGIIDMTRPAGGIQIQFVNCSFWQVNGPGGSSFLPPTASLAFGSAGVEFAMTNCTLYRNNPTQPLFSIVGLQGDNPAFSQISILGNLIYDTTSSTSAPNVFRITNTTGAWLRVMIQNNQIGYFSNLNYANPMLSLTGNGTALTFQGNANTGAGSGFWLSIQNDDHHFISGNSFNGPAGSWQNSLPASKWLGYYQDQYFQYGPPMQIQNLRGPVTVGASGFMGVFICDATAGVVQIDLPFANTAIGNHFSVKKIDSTSNAIIIVPAGTDTIENVAASKIITTGGGYVNLACNLYGWYIIGAG